MARGGRSKYPTYRIVAAESARAVTGRFVEILGHYNPHTKELVIKKDRVLERLSKGAQPSSTVARLLVLDGVELPAWVKLKTRTVAPAAPAAATQTAPAVKVVEETAEVTEAEAAAEAEETGEVAEDVVEDEVRVAEVAEESAAEISADAKSIDAVETAENAENAQKA